ncbi:AEC family transporter [Ornithinimicrobium sediminis]|uniref:AEC family transporter n=1 Tax=Ornithinimicrobium sediminis TaxID=2904603 RepID=UPI001E51FAEA|nr:AEC family transporter [Ornithinimicrobium sediminis]
MIAVLQGFALIAAVVAVGWLLAHTGLFAEAEQRMLAKLTFWVGSPALLFVIIADADVREIFSGFLVATFAGVVLTTVVYVVTARLVWRRGPGHLVMGAMSASYVNSNNLGVPIAAYVLGDAAIAAPILLLQLLLLQPVWLAALDLTSGRHTAGWRRALGPLTNPLTIASVLGLVVAITGVTVPALVLDPLELLAGLAIPGMLLAFGVSLRLSPLPGADGTGPELALIVAAKLLVMPLTTALVARQVLGLSETWVVAATVMAALPTAQNVFILAVTYGRGVAQSRDAIFLTTMLSMPVILVTVWWAGG